MLALLIELRQRCLKIILFFFFIFIIVFYNANALFTWITGPLATLLPEQSFIATQITAPVFTPFKLAADFALILTLPFVLSQLWRYIFPALYCHERIHLKFLIVSSICLFALGLVFCFYCILPLLFQFFVTAVPSQVKMLPDMGYTLDFITRMLVLFGFCFQVPLICFALVRFSILELEALIKIRPYVIVAAFILGMLLTPPEVLSQILLALPLCALYELGILLGRFNLLAVKRLKKPQSQSESSPK